MVCLIRWTKLRGTSLRPVSITRIAAAIAKATSKRFSTSRAYLSGEKNIGFGIRLLARERAAELLPRASAIGLNIGAGKRWPSRIWPMDYWVELIKRLKTHGLEPILLGGPEEVEMSARLVDATDCLASGVQSLETFYAMIERCECVVSAVTMAMHLAIGARTPLVLLNNIFNRYEFELYGRGEIVEPPTSCDCYYSGVCRTGRKCINEISPEAVFEAILRSLKTGDKAEDREHV